MAAPLIDFQLPRRPRRPRGARRGLGDGPRDHGRRRVRRRGQGGDPPGRRASQGSDLRDEILNRATSVYHGVGTCRMGVDERAVVGPDLKVRGIEGLRVADASIMPSITGGNTNAPAIMIGEKAAELILDTADPDAGSHMTSDTLTRPASITDELLDRITARVVSSGGGDWKLTEVYTGEVITTLPQSSPEDIETRLRPGPRGAAGLVAVAGEEAAQGLQAVPPAAARAQHHDRRPDPGRVRQGPADGLRRDLRPGRWSPRTTSSAPPSCSRRSSAAGRCR